MRKQEIERKMVIGLIASTDYIRKVRHVIKPNLILTPVASMLASWCCEYYDVYGKAPSLDIAEIYLTKHQQGLVPQDIALEIEEDILPDLSEDWVNYGLNVDSLVDSTHIYFKERALTHVREQLDVSLEKGELEDAEEALKAYAPMENVTNELILNDKEQLITAVSSAFKESSEPLIWYPGALGEFWNSSMIRGGFVALLAPEKRGKTAIMIDAAIRAVRQGRKVAFFQAGDMTEAQQLRRIAVYLAKNSDKERYVGRQLIPIKDCFYNQIDDCSNELRECDFGVFSDRKWKDVREARQDITVDDILDALRHENTYRPCHNCIEYRQNEWAMPYMQEIDVQDVLDENRAVTVLEDYFCKKNRNLRLCTFSNNTLTVETIQNILRTWQQRDDWNVDVIILDYADLCVDKSNREERHRQNTIWKKLRGLNQETNSLLITATQADADAYKQNTLRLSNFSEDKRKYAHVTAFYGLNQDSGGREKNLGLMRINELILREDKFDMNRQVTVMQALNIGRPIITSYW
jgi:hypothetical protein